MSLTSHPLAVCHEHKYTVKIIINPKLTCRVQSTKYNNVKIPSLALQELALCEMIKFTAQKAEF